MRFGVVVRTVAIALAFAVCGIGFSALIGAFVWHDHDHPRTALVSGIAFFIAWFVAAAHSGNASARSLIFAIGNSCSALFCIALFFAALGAVGLSNYIPRGGLSEIMQMPWLYFVAGAFGSFSPTIWPGMSDFPREASIGADYLSGLFRLSLASVAGIAAGAGIGMLESIVISRAALALHEGAALFGGAVGCMAAIILYAMIFRKHASAITLASLILGCLGVGLATAAVLGLGTMVATPVTAIVLSVLYFRPRSDIRANVRR